jgi:alpha-methylacyl-CoA racemase
MSGPLTGYRVVELAGIGPGPFAAMMLSDMGAEVLRVDRLPPAPAVRGDEPTATPQSPPPAAHRGDEGPKAPLDPLLRGRRSVGVDLRHRAGAEVVLRLVERADALIEGFRPGVTERLGIGPEPALRRNPRLVYGRMTGWGQEGPLARSAGHDINYIALAGVLAHIGRAGEAPVAPLNLVGDFGGGGMLLAFGVVCGLLEAGRSGRGQVIDAAMVDGAALLMTMMQGLFAAGAWTEERGRNLLDTGAPFYDTYETADGRFVSVGALEPQFFAELARLVGLPDEELSAHLDRQRWPALRQRLAGAFKARTSDEWRARLEGTDACFAPVLSMAEAPHHPHHRQRHTFVELAGAMQAGPAPRFSRTPGSIDRPPPHPGQHTNEALMDWGFARPEVDHLRSRGAVG